MKLKTRLFVAFYIIILVPLILSATVLFSFGVFQTHSIAEKYGVPLQTIEPSIRMLIVDILMSMIFILVITAREQFPTSKIITSKGMNIFKTL